VKPLQSKGPALIRAIVVSLVLTGATATAQSAGGPRGRQPSNYSITKVRFFGKQDSRTDRRIHQTSFLRGETTYINCEVSFNNHLYRRRSQSLDLVCRYYSQDGKKFGETKINYRVPASWKSGHAWRGWGWRLPGNWPVGSYRVDFLYDGRLVAEGRFKVIACSKSRLFDSGRSKALKRDYDGAISDFTTLIRRDSGYVRAYVERARAKRRKKDYTGAISDLDRAIRLDPEYVSAFGERAYNRMQLKDYPAAINDLSEAIRKDPKYEWAFRQRGSAREKNGDEIGAIADYKQALKLSPRNYTAFYRLIELRKKRKEIDAGIGDCTWLIQLDPKHYYFFKRRADLHKNKGNDDKALADYRKALSLKPSDRWTLSAIVRIHEKRNDLKEAIAECDWLIRLDPKNKAAYEERSRIRLKQKDYDGALADLDRVIEMDPKNANNYVSRAKAKAAMKDLDGAIADCTRAIEIKPKYYSAYSRRAEYHAKKGLNEEAIKDYRKSIELGRYGRGYTLGTILRLRKKMRDMEGAKADIAWAISLDPKKAWPYEARARWKQDQGDLKGAEEDCSHAIGLDSKNGPYLTRAKIRVLLKNVEGAMADCDRYLGSNPTKYKLVSTAATRHRAGNSDAAIEDCNRAIKIDPKYNHVYAMRSEILRDTGDYEKALADIEKAIQLRAWAYMYRERARLHLLMGNHDAAFADYATTIEKANPKAWAYAARAEAHYELGEYADAMRDFHKACELQAKSALNNHLMLFLVRCEQGERDEAARQLEAKLDTWKTVDKADMYIAAARHLLGDLDAEALLQKANEQPLQHSAAWQRAAHYYIGMRHRLDGRMSDAVKSLRLSCAGNHLTETTWRFGRANVRRVLLGMNVKPLPKEVASFLGLGRGAGLTITNVWEQSPTAAAGIQKGDVLVRLNGSPCTLQSIDKLFEQGNVGDKVRLEYARKGAKKSIDLYLGQSKPAMTAAPPADTK
jgi:tetratricopeptide (TPR) repeat protein